MSEIRVNPEIIAEQAQLLNAAKQPLESSSEEVAEGFGEGCVADDAAVLVKMLLEIKESLNALFELTTVFMDNTKNSYAITDSRISEGYMER